MLTQASNNPGLSVIVASYNAQATIVHCLSSLVHQETRNEYEIIVVDSSTDDTAVLIQKTFPSVRLLTFAERKFPGDARNHGIAIARGEIIAFVDADCMVGTAWVDAVMEAHKAPQPLISGVVENGSTTCALGWAYYFCEFSRWLPTNAGTSGTEIATCCLTGKKWVFEKYGPFLEGTYCSDAAFQWRCRQDNVISVSAPSIRIAHLYSDDIANFLRHMIFHRRSFAAIKSVEQKLPVLQRIGFVLLFPLLPFLLYLLIMIRVLRSNVPVRHFFIVTPQILAGLCARAWGELLGYLTGNVGSGNT